MPQGSRLKGKSNPKKPKITKVSKKGSRITKKTPKKSVSEKKKLQKVTEKKKLQKALETTIKADIENELRTKAGGSGLTTDKKKAAPSPKAKNVRKGKKK